MTVDANGYLHVVWKGTQDLVSPFHYEIYHSRSTNGGVSWSGLSQMTMVSYNAVGEPSANIPDVGADSQGNVIVVWDEEYANGDNEIFVSTSTDGGQTWTGTTQEEIISFPDGHPAYRPFIVAGVDDTLHVTWNETTTTSYYQIHYSRGNAIGLAPAVDIVLTPVNPPIIIPPGGGNFDYQITLTNNESNPVNFDAWTMVQLPNLSWHGPLLGPVSLTLAGSASITRQRTQSIPSRAPAGNYVYSGYVGDYPAKWDSSGFTFQKAGAGDWGLGAGDWVNTGEAISADGEDLRISVSPNPFNPTTVASYELREASNVSLRVYDTAGRLVATLVDGWRQAGMHEVSFDGSELASGIYLAKLEAGEFTAVQKMALLK